MTKSSKLKVAAFPEDQPFEVYNYEAVALTGCTRYLAAAMCSSVDSRSRLFLMNRLGKLLAMDSDQANSTSASGPNPIHRMEFCVSKTRIFIVTQNLFSFVSLYLVNPKVKATLSYIKTLQL